MATITLHYDARNSIAKKTIKYILSLGVFTVIVQKKKSSFERSQDDINTDVYLPLKMVWI